MRAGVHPRACGGSGRASVSFQSVSGPSPRVRGKHRRVVLVGERLRSIPARAGEAATATSPRPASRVHPRACGGSQPDDRHQVEQAGPSPRVRGKLRQFRARRQAVGSIPARAGEASPRSPKRPRSGVHPRACGGSIVWEVHQDSVNGPSPRVRGKRIVGPEHARGDGSIPARAGEASPHPPSQVVERVHPRACGGSRRVASDPSWTSGPSPRVRGKRSVLHDANPVAGSIPARAGEAILGFGGPRFARVHPRACGGSSRSRSTRRCRWGPSPRVRGKPQHLRARGTDGRSIPARAGEATTPWRGRKLTRVHPRACGGSGFYFAAPHLGKGPSPRVRGKRVRPGLFPLSHRSIPARAGEAWRYYVRKRQRTVHPRACGGSTSKHSRRGRWTGPSPRVRGKPGLGGHGCSSGGSIPARAGEARTTRGQGHGLPVHPRACGGSVSSVPLARWREGPSPRVRGKLGQLSVEHTTVGSIPARAGEATTRA